MSIPGVIAMSFLTALIVFGLLAIITAMSGFNKLAEVFAALALLILGISGGIILGTALFSLWMQALGYGS